MIRLRKFILGLMWLVPLIYGIAAATIPSFIFHLVSERAYGGYSVDSGAEYRILRPIAYLVLLLLAISPPAICIASVGTLLQYYRRKLSARSWAIACGMSFIIAGVATTIAETFVSYLESIHPESFIYSGPHSSIPDFPFFGVLHLAIGTLIVVAFRPRGSISDLISTDARPVKVKGDGTTSFSYLFAVVFAFVALAIIDSYIRSWGIQHGLRQTSGFLVGQLTFFGALFISVALHELGHILAGFSVGMKLLSIRIGPFHMEIKEGRWKMILPDSWKCVFQAGVLVIPPNPNDYSKAHAIWKSAGGPLASLAAGILALLAVFTAKGSFYEPIWELLGLVATISLVFFVANLIPLREALAYSDGANIFQLLAGNVMADYRRIIHMTQATTIASIRPRDFDISFIEQTASNESLEPYVVTFLHVVAGDCYFDRENIEGARAALSKAEAAAEKLPRVWKETCESLVLRAVCIAHSQEMAEKWWERGLQAPSFESKRTSEFDVIAYSIIKG